MANQKVTVPDIGDYHDVPVIELLVQNGDAIDKDAPLLVIESDKATLEVPAPASGIVRNLKLKVGDKVSQGVPICELETAAAAEAPPAQEPAAKADAPANERSEEHTSEIESLSSIP